MSQRGKSHGKSQRFFGDRTDWNKTKETAQKENKNQISSATA
jgi:hypothetical protein